MPENREKRWCFEMRLTGADILVECLIEQGVDTIFGFPGFWWNA